MFIGESWDKIHDDDREEFRFPVYLTYFGTKLFCLSAVEASKCHRRHGKEWRKPIYGDWILDQRIHNWLEENIGYEDLVWPIDRIYYPDEILPDIPGGSEYTWRKRGMVPRDPDETQWVFGRLLAGQRDPSFHDQFSNIIFKSAEKAQKFYDFWNIVEPKWVIDYVFDHPLFEGLAKPSPSFINWMIECVGAPAKDVIDFKQGNGQWCTSSVTIRREKDNPNKTNMMVWFRDPKMFPLAKLTWGGQS